MENTINRVSGDEIKRFIIDVMIKAGVPPADAEIEADVLVWANMRGVDSHGVLRIPLYVDYLRDGIMNPNPNIQVINETPATVFIEADNALGPVVTKMAMNIVMEKARNVGMGWGLIRNTSHQGAMAYYSLMAAEQGMAGIASVCSPPNMVPYGAKSAGVHNSPIAIAVPGLNHKPISLDMATSVVAGGKLDLAKDKGEAIPDNWAVDSNGNPTTDPNLKAALLPIAGPKGAGLALMFECLSSLMVGNPLLQPRQENKSRIKIGMQNSFIAAVNIATFTDLNEYREDVDRIVDGIKSLPRADGADEIFLPGEPENRVYEDRSVNGIPLPVGTIKNLREVALRLDVKLPVGI